MRPLPRPSLAVDAVFSTCISRVRDQSLKLRLSGISLQIAEASAQFDELASSNHLHLLEKQAVIGGVTTAELEAVYTQRMVSKNSPGRSAYDELLNSAPLGKCPLCGHRTVSTLDHHLPKAHYPALAVAPLNLLPACADCNKRKLARVPMTSAEEMLHPYYDDIEADHWLHATVIEQAPTALVFSVVASGGWSEVLLERVQDHFRVLGLGSLYSAEAADELLNIRHQLETLHAAGGRTLVQSHLQARAESCRAARLNSWRTATYNAFAQSPWFCDGGFR